jgi:integrase
VEAIMPRQKPTPVDDYLSAVREKNAERDDKHKELWQTWKQDPNPQTLQPLLHQFEPIFSSKVREWKAPNTNEAAFRADLNKRAINAFENYDPNKASLVTHVNNYLKKSKRFNTRNQNLAYIPEEKAKYIGKIDAARDQLYDEFGREPTHSEVGSIVGISGRRVKEIQGLRRADIIGSSFQSDPQGHVGSRDQEVISLLRQELKGDEQKVYDYVYGQNGMPKIESTGEIARRMGKSDSQVSRIKNRIAEVYKKYV